MKIKVNQLGIISEDGTIEVDPPNPAFQYPVFTGSSWIDNKQKFDDLNLKLDQMIQKSKVPEVVFMRQARLALLDVGLLDNVQQVLTGLPEPMKSFAAIEWEYATEVRRDWPTLKQITAYLNLTDEYVDDLFILAATK